MACPPIRDNILAASLCVWYGDFLSFMGYPDGAASFLVTSRNSGSIRTRTILAMLLIGFAGIEFAAYGRKFVVAK
jgi:hypothetical protein